jgi:uncharacterized protein YecT (DUF1311 family)
MFNWELSTSRFLAKLTGPDRETLREEQRKWLAARNKACPIYKGWVGCLSDYYQKRIDELKKRSPATPPKNSSHFL